MTTRAIDQVYEVVRAAGSRGLTDPEIAEALKVTPAHIKGLRRQLQLAGRLKRTTDDPNRRNFHNQLLAVWIVNE
jgi:hypothetical protein